MKIRQTMNKIKEKQRSFTVKMGLTGFGNISFELTYCHSLLKVSSEIFNLTSLAQRSIFSAGTFRSFDNKTGCRGKLFAIGYVTPPPPRICRLGEVEMSKEFMLHFCTIRTIPAKPSLIEI